MSFQTLYFNLKCKYSQQTLENQLPSIHHQVKDIVRAAFPVLSLRRVIISSNAAHSNKLTT